MSTVNDELREKVSEYRKRIQELEQKIEHAGEEEKREYDFELADLKAQLTLAESELKDTWGDTHEGTEDVGKKIQESNEESLDTD